MTVAALVLAWMRAHRGFCEIVATVLILALAGAAAVEHERGIGAVKCEQKNTDALVAEQVRDGVRAGLDAAAINQQAKTYAAAIVPSSYILPGPVRVCVERTPSQLSKAATPGRVGNGPPDVPSPDRGAAARRGAPGPGGGGELAGSADVGKPLENVGRHADAQVAELQAYVRDVCQGAAK